MKLCIILNTNDPEISWNTLRLGNEAITEGHKANLFLLGPGVELQNIQNKNFDVPEALKKFSSSGSGLFAFGTCLELRQQEAGVCPISTKSELLEMISDSDKVVTCGQ